MYQTTGPARLQDPTTYYRLAGWYAFRAHAVGSAFWAFGDTGGAETSWNDYAGGELAYAPAFIGRHGVTDSVHWQAVREGVEDHEYLAMLRDAADRTADARWKVTALRHSRHCRGADRHTGWFEWTTDPAHAADDYRSASTLPNRFRQEIATSTGR
jgi:hypothetical protein